MENHVNQLKDTYKRLVDLQGKQFADTSPLYATCPMLNFGKTVENDSNKQKMQTSLTLHASWTSKQLVDYVPIRI